MRRGKHKPRRLRLLANAKGSPLSKLKGGKRPRAITTDDDNELVAPLGAAVTLQAAKEGDAKQLRRFEMEAYNGGTMRFWWSDDPVVVDLAGMAVSDKPRPIFKNHRSDQIVGHTEKVSIEAGALSVRGVVSGSGRVAREVVEAADNGFPWQASMGADVERIEEVRAGVDVEVNGQTFTGPLLVVRASRLGEVSFVPLGADDSTAARMVADKNRHHPPTQEKPMGFKAWLKAQGIDLATLNAAQIAALRAAYDAATDKGVNEEEQENPAWATLTSLVAAFKSQEPIVPPKSDDDDPLAETRKLQAAETRRVAAIRKACAGKHADLEAKAIEEAWTQEKLELEVLRAERATAPNIRTRGDDESLSDRVLEAAVMQAGRFPGVEKLHDEQTLEAADRRYRGRISLQELLLEAAWANGYTGRTFRQSPVEVLRAAFAGQLQAAGFSSIDISGILSNVANKFLLDGFGHVDSTWRRIAAIGQVVDFKTVTRYRLTGDSEYVKVPPGGEIKHGQLGEESFTNKADTYAKMYGISRSDLINDDLGALTDIPRKLGRGAALKLNTVFWTAFMDNASFFATGNKNFQSGAGSALSIDSLTDAEVLFFNQVDPDGKPLGVTPKVLLVPPALLAAASQLMRSLEIRDTTASTKIGVSNPHAGKFDAVATPYLSNASFSGNSAKKWYLLADPMDLATIEAVFLNGQEAPTIESSDADFNQLGIQMRGYHDFGVAKQEHRAGVASKGEA